ncbi:hypothetical protein GIB67_036053 [Kingdonia uniflora]|uniref:CCHC-type domain-containing protein n=1 Tax=Kingdonia uniflora TaxID=39325 RepID=A0A7J7N1G8_9MAGN|nr:hypothetical protein GIB67_036053 [Kingdonia uniflora]
MEEAENVLHSMVVSGCEPNVISYTILINGYCKAKRLDEAIQIFENMRSKGLTPDVITYNSMIDGLYKLDNGSTPNELTYNTIFRRLLKHNKLNKAMQLRNEMVERDFSLDANNISIIVGLLACDRPDFKLTGAFDEILPKHRREEAFIGVNVGTDLSDMPNPTQVVALLKAQQIRHVRLYDAHRAMLLALANSGIRVTVSVPNNELLGVGQSNATAANWITRNVVAHVPATNITAIAVGSEILTTLPNAAPILVSALKFIHSALVASNLDNQIKVSTPHSSSIILDFLVGRPPSLSTRVDRIKGSIDELKDGMSKMQECFRLLLLPKNKASNTTEEAATSAENPEVFDEQQSKESIYDEDKKPFEPLAEDLFFNHFHEDTRYVQLPRRPQTTTQQGQGCKNGSHEQFEGMNINHRVDRERGWNNGNTLEAILIMHLHLLAINNSYQKKDLAFKDLFVMADAVKYALKSEELYTPTTNSSTISASTVQANSTSTVPRTFVYGNCFGCRKPGHQKNDCPQVAKRVRLVVDGMREHVIVTVQ